MYCYFIMIHTVYYDTMYCINIVEAHCHVAELTSSGGIDEQFVNESGTERFSLGGEEGRNILFLIPMLHKLLINSPQ